MLHRILRPQSRNAAQGAAMSADYQKGRADAAKGKYDPPKHSMFESEAAREKMAQRIQEYREGYYDKRREMGLKN